MTAPLSFQFSTIQTSVYFNYFPFDFDQVCSILHDLKKVCFSVSFIFNAAVPILLTFSSENSFRDSISVKKLRSRPGPTFCGPDVGPNCSKKLSADNNSSH